MNLHIHLEAVMVRTWRYTWRLKWREFEDTVADHGHANLKAISEQVW